MIRRRAITLFSLSFLDTISCGFGAIILLFILTIGSQNDLTKDVRNRLQRIMAEQLATLAKFRTDKDDIQRKQTQALEIAKALAEKDTLKALLDQMQQQIQLQRASQAQTQAAIDSLNRDFAARQKKTEIELTVEPTPLGLPADSNYVAFIVDSSGSMRDPTSEQIWPMVLKKFDEVLDSYPRIDGLQFLDADGRFILTRAGEKWLPDTPEVRNAVKEAISNYRVFSNSNPVPGILRAVRQLHDKDDPKMKMGVFILGDEFTGTADSVLRRMDELNPRGPDGKRPIVINAIGFPTAIRLGFSMANTGVKYANLLRQLCYEHGGAFIALQEIELVDNRQFDRRNGRARGR